MFKELTAKFHTFPEHHQIFITVIVATLVIVASWAIEKILEEFLPNKAMTYVMTFLMSLVLLWIIKHFILHIW